MNTSTATKSGLHATVSLSKNFADQLVLVMEFGEHWQSHIQKPGRDSNAMLLNRCKSVPFCHSLVTLDVTRFAVSIDMASIRDQDDRLPSIEETSAIVNALLLILAELSDAEWSFEFASDWREA